MPLTYQVLRCFKCSVFQVHQTKKARTWACKLCDEKQSLKRFYCLGTAKECRLHVQTLNGIRGEIEDTQCTLNTGFSDDSNSPTIPEVEIEDYSNTPKKSKWEDFLDAYNEEDQQNPDENSPLNSEVVSEQPKKRLKKAPKNSTKIPNKNNHSSPAKSENNFRKGKPIPIYKEPVTVIYKAKPISEHVSGSKQCNLIKPGFPPADTDLSWIKFVEEHNLNDPSVNNDHSQCGPSEWFPSIDDKDLDAILEF